MLVEFAIDVFEVPHLVGLVLDPFEVGDGDAAGIAEDGGKDFDAALGEDAFAGGGGRGVGALGDDDRVDHLRFFFLDHLLKSGGDEDFDLGLVELFLADGGSLGVAADAAFLLDVGGEVVGVDALVVLEEAGVIGDGDELGALLLEDLGGPGTDVAEAQHAEGALLGLEAEFGEHFDEGVNDALAGGFFAAERAAVFDGLAGDDGGGIFTADVGKEGVGVGDPGHVLGVGADVGRGDVVIRADTVGDGGREATDDALHLAVAVLAGIDLDAALAAAEGHADERALHGHEEGERLDVVEMHVVMKAEAALVGAEGVVVLNAIALEEPVVTVVHLHGEVDHDFGLGLGEDDLDAVRQTHQLGGVEHGADGLAVEVVRVGREAKFVEDGRVVTRGGNVFGFLHRRRGLGESGHDVSASELAEKRSAHRAD